MLVFTLFLFYSAAYATDDFNVRINENMTLIKELMEITETDIDVAIDALESIADYETKLEEKQQVISDQLEQIRNRRNNYQKLYGGSQKALRVYFDQDFLESISADYTPVSELIIDYEEYYKNLQELLKKFQEN